MRLAGVGQPKYTVLWLIVLLGVGVRLAYLWRISAYPNFTVPYAGLDEAMYHDLALRVAQGDLRLGDDVYHYSPLYPYVLGGLYACFGAHPLVARLANIVFGLGTIVCLFFFTRRFFQSLVIASVAALGAALYGPFVVFDTSRMKVSLDQCCLAFAFWLLASLTDDDRRWRWVALGAVLGLVLNLNAQVSLFVIALCGWIFVRPSASLSLSPSSRIWERRRALQCGLFVGGMVLTIAPFTFRNYLVAGDFTLLTTKSGVHFYIGNHPRAWGGYTPIPGVRPNPAGLHTDARLVAEKTAGRSLSAAEASRYWRNKALDFLREEPLLFLQLLGRKLLLVLSSYEIPNNENYQYLVTQSGLLAWLLGIGVVLPLGLTGLVWALPTYPRFAPLILFFLTYCMSLLLTFITDRYRAPLLLVLLPFAAFCLNKLWDGVAARAWRSVLRAASITAGFALIAWSSPGISDARRQTDLQRAAAKMHVCREERRIREEISIHERREGARVESRIALLWLQWAELRASQHDLEGAIHILREALKTAPDHPLLAQTLAHYSTRLGETSAMEAPRRLEQRSPARNCTPEG